MPGPAVASWSGGKDGCLAVYRAQKSGYDVRFLLNFISRESKRGCFHGLAGDILKYQGELMGIPLVQWEVSPDMLQYETEFKEAVTTFKDKGIYSMVFGDIYLEEHENWIARVCRELRINAVEPLWKNPVEELLLEFIGAGFKAVIVSCKADVMGKEYIGRVIDTGLIDELKKKGICPCGEKGEFHTLVVDGPCFKKPLEIVEAETIIKEGFWTHWFLDIKKFQ
ncbi:MAG TPA: diphthine--ammonia ligase [Candidatus Omnitrophota bacterium]|nr:diphthine--ammonia ligase [Candidatus Omnitrophota bacterium]HPT07584.1 diphthine--ammonia ligase [Candidatus Omnitrophota bacterium]